MRSNERIMALGRLEELKLLADQRIMAVEEARRAIREATGPLVAAKDIESSRVVYLAGELVLALDSINDEQLGLRPILAEIRRLKQEYGI